jgi:hypothetical protein
MAPWVTEKFLAVLQGLEERYKQSKGSDRKEVIEEAVQDITASAEKDGVAIPPGLEKVLSHCHQHSVIDPHSPSRKFLFGSRTVIRKQSSQPLPARPIVMVEPSQPGQFARWPRRPYLLS